MKRFALLAFAFNWLAACDSPSAPTPLTAPTGAPSFARIANDRIEITGIEFNPCPPTERVEFSGSMHFLVTGEVKPTSTAIKTHINAQGIAGVGLTSGDQYRVLRNFKEDLVVTAWPSRSSDEIDVRFRLVRKGSEAKLWVRQTIRVTFPPFKFEILRNELECRG